MPSTAALEESLFDDAETEHITITADIDEEESEPELSGDATTVFSQTLIGRDETRSFSIDGRFLSVNISQAHTGERQYQFNLAFLDSEPRRFSGVAWNWLWVALGHAGLTMVALAISSVVSTPFFQQAWLPVNILLVVATTLTFLMFAYRTRFTLTFYSRHGGAPLLELAALNPNRAAVDDFVRELQQRIDTAHEAHWQSKPQFLRDELRMHFRLFEEGVLAEDVYEASKVRVLRAHD